MDKRVKFDFKIDFTNGGGLQGRDFRLDIPGDDISNADLADYLVEDLRLLMVGAVRISNKQIIPEKHKRKAALVDLSHTIEDGLVTYKGLPAPIICDYLSREKSRELYAPGTEFQIAKIEMIANTGTYLDCPFHRYPTGKDLSEVSLESFTDLPGIVVRADHRQGLAVGVEYFEGKGIRNRAVLVHTGWDQYWNSERYYTEHPFLTEEAAVYLKNHGAKLVGIDSMNIDDTRGKSRPVHSTLLAENILIVEHLCKLGKLPEEGFVFNAIPPKFKGVGTFPVRAMARIK
jgi:kynurenine formamidase